MVYTGFMAKPIGKPPDTYTGSLSDWKLLTTQQRTVKVNAVKIREKRRISHMKHRTKNKVQCALWKAKNKESVDAKRKFKRKINKVEINKKEKQYYIDNKEKVLKRCAVYKKENTKKVKTKACAKARARRVKEREALYERIAVAVAASNKEIAERA